MLLLIFRLGDQDCALHLESVERVLRAVKITPLADAPRNVPGVINLHGRIVPVLDLRLQLGLPAKASELSDQFIIAQVEGRTIALLVDAVRGVAECPAERETQAEAILPGLESLEGIACLEGGMVIIEDLDRLCTRALGHLEDPRLG